jgi:2-polyprenyl-3-methyl-5-hydroxy-6-metoxy-1,4-benzoquinol methylase
MNDDQATAEAFAKSWNHLPSGSVYTFEQFADWLAPLTRMEIEGKSVLELGCGNASLLVHLTRWQPSQITGVDLGSSTEAALRNVRQTGYQNYSIIQADLTAFSSGGFDIVCCIGVLHHLKDPAKGFESVIANVKSGGRFHCWVYAREGNGVVINLVDPLRKITSRLPWMMTKYLIAAPLAALYFVYAKSLRKLRRIGWVRKAPFFEYSLWIAQRPFSFFRHVAFDQLVAPRTAYIDKRTVQSWLTHPKVDPENSYIVFRNGNSWKFGGRVR